MKPMRLIAAVLMSLLISLTLWSCNKDTTPTKSASPDSAPEQTSPPPLSGGMAGAGGGMMDPLRAGCPMVVPGAAVTVSDTEGAVALTFTTDTGDVADLRARVQHMAQMYEMPREQAGMMWHHLGGEGGEGMGYGGLGMGGGGMGQGGPGMGGGGMGQGGPGMGGGGMGQGGPGMGGEGMGHLAGRGPMPAASATMTNTDLGARLELRPNDASQLDALREHVRWHQQRMHSGECWMLQGQPTATPPGQQE